MILKYKRREYNNEIQEFNKNLKSFFAKNRFRIDSRLQECIAINSRICCVMRIYVGINSRRRANIQSTLCYSQILPNLVSNLFINFLGVKILSIFTLTSGNVKKILPLRSELIIISFSSFSSLWSFKIQLTDSDSVLDYYWFDQKWMKLNNI